MTFEDLNISRPLLNAIDDLGYVNPTPIQSESFSVVLSGKDIVGTAQTGTGKTFAYLLPMLKNLKYSEQQHPRVLIVVPTRELVVQVTAEIEKLTKYMNVRFAGVYGGTNINNQKKVIYAGLDILVGTPRRLMDLSMTGVLRFKAIRQLVIDEVDEMLEAGFRPQLISLMELLPPRRQNIMFSATLSEEVSEIIDDFFMNPSKIEIVPHGTPIERIKQTAYHVPNFHTKVNLLENLLNNDEELSKVLVFVGNKKLADRLFEHLSPKFENQIGVVHSNKSQNFRLASLDRFQEGLNRVLISTDIMARGLDICDVSHVINFDTPNIPEDYIHRIGRTGRADKDGEAIVFINEVEQEYVMAIEELMKKAVPVAQVPEEVEISNIYTEEEKPKPVANVALKTPKLTQSKGAFHEKKEKNKKKQSGSPSRNKPKYKKSGKKIKNRR